MWALPVGDNKDWAERKKRPYLSTEKCQFTWCLDKTPKEIWEVLINTVIFLNRWPFLNRNLFFNVDRYCTLKSKFELVIVNAYTYQSRSYTGRKSRMCPSSDRIERGRQRGRRPKRDDSKDWLRESEQSKVMNLGDVYILIHTSKWSSKLLEPEEWEAYCTLNSSWSDNKTWVHPAGAPPQADLEGRDQERQGRLLGLHLALPRQRRQDALRVPRPRHRVRQEVAGAPGRSAHTSLIKAETSNMFLVLISYL